MDSLLIEHEDKLNLFTLKTQRTTKSLGIEHLENEIHVPRKH